MSDVVILLIIIGGIAAWGFATDWTFSGLLPRKGAKCTPAGGGNVKNATEYVYDDYGKCIISKCKEKWKPDTSNTVCISSISGTSCEFEGTKIDKGVYRWSSQNACEVSKCTGNFKLNASNTACDTCMTGYNLTNGSCEPEAKEEEKAAAEEAAAEEAAAEEAIGKYEAAETEDGEFFNEKLTPYNGKSVFCKDDERTIYRVMNSVLRPYGSMPSVRSWEEDTDIDTDEFERIDCQRMGVKIGPYIAGTRIEEEGGEYYAAGKYEGKIVECEDEGDARYKMQNGKLRKYTSEKAYDFDKKNTTEIELDCLKIPRGDNIYYEEAAARAAAVEDAAAVTAARAAAAAGSARAGWAAGWAAARAAAEEEEEEQSCSSYSRESCPLDRCSLDGRKYCRNK